jgi:BlaI family penicillinase repressor
MRGVIKLSNLSNKISNAELEIMQVIWAAGKEMTYSQIWDAVEHNSKSTTQTLITRLVNKGILKQDKRDVYYYMPTITKHEYSYAKTNDLMNRVYSGSAKDLVSALFQENALSEEDFEELKEFWSGGKVK